MSGVLHQSSELKSSLALPRTAFKSPFCKAPPEHGTCTLRATQRADEEDETGEGECLLHLFLLAGLWARWRGAWTLAIKGTPQEQQSHNMGDVTEPSHCPTTPYPRAVTCKKEISTHV
ncbi:hypothetical protein P7K49_025666 [Saguinus oedipus]|uniref:Uncharacterized protein n=1 Tax=Saguinus oedipus TaxID=9490 RepID=A0ABQ9UHT7_SAGOE|nr:hypothetical protein P7K49_025666 [Saguinus oedipus]